VATAVVITAASGTAGAAGIALGLLSNRYAIEIAIERARATPGVELVAVVIPHGEAEESLVETALDSGAFVTRARPEAPLWGVAKAAREAGADRVLHVPGVQPFFDPVIAGGVLGLLTDAEPDIATNAAPALFPDGLDCEAVSAAMLAAITVDTPGARLLDAFDGARLANLRGPGGGMERLRGRLEQEADFAFARAVHTALGPAACKVGAAEIAGLCLRRPDITALNADLVDQSRLSARDRGAAQTRPVSFLRAA
jgi:spore coat polysaccharide biosynthesis protein SpsF (cytidylyltransferase family)